MIQPNALGKSCMVQVRCVHGDVVKYLLMSVAIQFQDKSIVWRLQLARTSDIS